MSACSIFIKIVPTVLLVLYQVSPVSASVSNHTDGLFLA